MSAALFPALGVVAALLALLPAALRRTGLARAGAGRLPMRVVQRLALSPKQGLAVVRVGERFLVLSTGEGGVHSVVELGDEERAALLASETPATPLPAAVLRNARVGVLGAGLRLLAPRERRPAAVDAAVPAPAPDFAGRLRAALRVAAVGMLMLAAPAALRAQEGATAGGMENATAALRVGEIEAAGVEDTARPARDATLARADSMLRRASERFAEAPTASAGGAAAAGTPMPPLSGTVGVVVMMGLLTLLPTLVLMMTGFTRILIVLHFLKQAIGTQTAPPGYLIGAMSLLLTGFVMAPTLAEANRDAVQPWLDGRIEQTEMLERGVVPFRGFMLRQTHETDLALFLELSHTPTPPTVEQVPLVVLTSAFVTSELRTAFQIGFILFLPFIVIDIVVASVLNSMGMFMLPPAIISLPFKLLLFVLVDGWALLIQSLIQTFH